MNQKDKEQIKQLLIDSVEQLAKKKNRDFVDEFGIFVRLMGISMIVGESTTASNCNKN